MEITANLRKRFVKDYKLPIKIYDEPYFSYQLNLYDDYYNCVEKYEAFKLELNAFNNEEDYFAYYRSIKEKMMYYIKNSTGYTIFNSPDHYNDIKKNEVNITNLPTSDIYKDSNIGKTFLSIDMIKANFNTLRYFNPEMFNYKDTWEDFCRMFTDSEYIINSKYIREVIFGNCNPKRQIQYEKYLMSSLLPELPIDKIVFFSNDEIVLDITNMTNIDDIKEKLRYFVVPLRLETFTLNKVLFNNNIIGYIKNLEDNSIQIKKVNPLYMPIIVKKLKNKPLQEEDLVFEHENILCKLLSYPTIYIE